MGQSSIIQNYYPGLSKAQLQLFDSLPSIYEDWNRKVNLISRKDIDQLTERHVLHSLAIAKVIRFNPGAKVLDVGTGGGFPGIPLAIFFPDVKFILVDSIEKKIKAVADIVHKLGLKNVEVIRSRVEDLNLKVDYVVSRATAPFPDLVKWTKNQLVSGQMGSLPNGWLILKGGDLKEELQNYGRAPEIQFIIDLFPVDFFENKMVVYLARQIL